MKSVNDSPAFKAIAAHVPPAAIFIECAKPEGIEYLAQVLKEMSASLDAGAAEKEEDKSSHSSATKWLDVLKKTPPAAILTKVLVGFVSYGTTEERGIGVTSKIVFKRKE